MLQGMVDTFQTEDGQAFGFAGVRVPKGLENSAMGI